MQFQMRGMGEKGDGSSAKVNAPEDGKKWHSDGCMLCGKDCVVLWIC